MGYIYAVGFSDGTCKVGKSSNNPVGRIKSHESFKRRIGAKKENEYISCNHDNYSENERNLISSLRGKFNKSHEYKEEWFDCSFDNVKEEISNLKIKESEKKIDGAISTLMLFMDENKKLKNEIEKNAKDISYINCYKIFNKWAKIILKNGSNEEITSITVDLIDEYKDESNVMWFMEVDELFTLILINSGLDGLFNYIATHKDQK